MQATVETAHRDLWKWCRAQGYAGYDPYDALNSRVFQATPLSESRTWRLAWTQFHKRSPINFRSWVKVPRERNAKGIALLALAALADYRRTETKEAEIEARELLDDLMWMRLKGLRGACWGYNFDWQSRSFFLPRGTPTIVPTAFAARALCEAAAIFGREDYLPFARTVCDFILNDLNRSAETSEEMCFSYSPFDQTRVFNASLLAAEVLATVGALTQEQTLSDMAMRAARYVVRQQTADGSWAYGADGLHAWSDSFHTAFILVSLSRISRAVAETSRCSSPLMTSGEGQFTTDQSYIDGALRRGYDSWRETFFLQNGWPKYFADRLYPADIHCAASAIIALVELRKVASEALDLASKIAEWSIENLWDKRGYFYYQRRRFYRVRIPYMRWSEAWMTYALARLLEVTH
jgi:hypothetical protein